MSDLIERLRERADDMEFATNLDAEAAAQLEAQQAEIAEYKKQIKQMGSSVQHYEHLAMKFSSQADVYSHGRQRAWAEIARLREALEFYAKDHAWPNEGPWGAGSDDFGLVARKALEQKS